MDLNCGRIIYMKKRVNKKFIYQKMEFHKSVVPQVFDGKISTWRLRDHKLKKNNVVAFENSQTQEIFGFGKIIKIIKTTVGGYRLKRQNPL